jgi:carbon starvation protein
MSAQLAAGPAPEAVESLRRQLFNDRVDAGVTSLFVILVATVVLANARVWWQLLSRRRPVVLHEEPYVALSEA